MRGKLEPLPLLTEIWGRAPNKFNSNQNKSKIDKKGEARKRMENKSTHKWKTYEY